MNERIQELILQAGFEPHYESYEQKFEKFADLIVRECIAEIEQSHCGSNDEWDRALRSAIHDIEQRFGI